MNDPISTLMQKRVITVDTNASVDRVEEILNSNRLSCVPVVDARGKCFGVISTPDLVHFHALHKDSKTKLAWEVCTHKIIEVSPDISVMEAAELMIKNNIHHIVLTENKSIKGIVSSIDIVEEYLLKQNKE